MAIRSSRKASQSWTRRHDTRIHLRSSWCLTVRSSSQRWSRKITSISWLTSRIWRSKMWGMFNAGVNSLYMETASMSLRRWSIEGRSCINRWKASAKLILKELRQSARNTVKARMKQVELKQECVVERWISLTIARSMIASSKIVKEKGRCKMHQWNKMTHYLVLSKQAKIRTYSWDRRISKSLEETIWITQLSYLRSDAAARLLCKTRKLPCLRIKQESKLERITSSSWHKRWNCWPHHHQKEIVTISKRPPQLQSKISRQIAFWKSEQTRKAPQTTSHRQPMD